VELSSDRAQAPARKGGGRGDERRVQEQGQATVAGLARSRERAEAMEGVEGDGGGLMTG